MWQRPEGNRRAMDIDPVQCDQLGVIQKASEMFFEDFKILALERRDFDACSIGSTSDFLFANQPSASLRRRLCRILPGRAFAARRQWLSAWLKGAADRKMRDRKIQQRDQGHVNGLALERPSNKSLRSTLLACALGKAADWIMIIIHMNTPSSATRNW